MIFIIFAFVICFELFIIFCRGPQNYAANAAHIIDRFLRLDKKNSFLRLDQTLRFSLKECYFFLLQLENEIKIPKVVLLKIKSKLIIFILINMNLNATSRNK